MFGHWNSIFKSKEAPTQETEGDLGERRRQIASRVAALEGVVRDHAHGLLPIALAPKLLKSLLEQLAAEQDVRVGVVVDETLDERGEGHAHSAPKRQDKEGRKERFLWDHPGIRRDSDRNKENPSTHIF